MELLIVDDEISALEAVQQNIKWDTLPYMAIHTATGCESARRLLAYNSNIQVLLCDIEMPMGSGLDLLEWINEKRPDVICIFMTCHAEFDYARRALQLNSFDYILKPLDFDSLTKVLQKAAKEIEKRRQEEDSRSLKRKAVKEHFWRKLFSGEIPQSRRSIEEYIHRMEIGIDLHNHFLPIMVIPSSLGEEHRVEDRNLHSASLRNICIQMLQVSGYPYDIETLADGRIIAVFALEEEGSEAVLQKELMEFAVSLNAFTKEFFNSFTVVILGFASEIEDIPNQLERIYQLIYYYWEIGSRDQNGASPYYLLSNKMEIVAARMDMQDKQIAKVTAYIRDHLQGELSLEQLAEIVFLNPDYLNRIFKKKMNTTLSAYVVRQKIEKAQYMLRNTSIPIADVASSVGYYNYSSFNRSFKRVTGMTPQEWKLGGK